MQDALNEMAMLRQELEQSGQWRPAELLGRAEMLLATGQATLAASQTGREIARLQAVIRHAIPYQTNQEVARWLHLALQPGAEITDAEGQRRDRL